MTINPQLYVVAVAPAILIAGKVRRTKFTDDLIVAVLLVLAEVFILPVIGGVAFSGITYLRPETVDSYLHGLDLTLGLRASVLTGFCLQHAAFWFICMQAYNALILMFAIHWAVERSMKFFRAAGLGALLCFPFYLLLPACGPRYATGGDAIALLQPRNCFPSMHMAWALLLILNAKNRTWRLILIGYAGVLVFATIVSGEHYFVDLIAAVPFSLGVQWLAGHRMAWKVRYAKQTVAMEG
jgi:hypothetical protein